MMGDHFNDYPQTVGARRPSWQESAIAMKEQQKEESATRTAPFHLYKWAQYLIPDEDELPCQWNGDHKLYISQYEAIVREYFPESHVGRWEILKSDSLDQVFRRLGLEVIPVQEWEK